jgi:hypothetical protein
MSTWDAECRLLRHLEKRPVRIANASGFLGDRASALREVVEGGPIDVVTGDYLAELTMMILGKQQAKAPGEGYAKSFLAHLAPVVPTILDRGIKVVVNAGGLNPRGLAEAVRALSERAGRRPAIALIDGDDMRPRLADLLARGHSLASLETGEPLAPERAASVLTANAYLGGFGIARALEAGADLVICPRVTDAALVVGSAAWWHAWKRDDWNALAGAVAAGHVIECGTQATGGNYSSFRTIANPIHLGFPIAEVSADGSSIITKHPGTGGAVTIGTVTAQLVYEVTGTRYLNPDVTTRLDTIELEEVDHDRVAIRNTRGAPPPSTTKVAITTKGFYRNEMTFAFVGLDIDGKMALFERTVRAELPKLDLVFQRIGAAREDAAHQDEATSFVRVIATSRDEAAVARAFSSALVEQALASYPGLFVLGMPAGATDVGGYWPAVVPQAEVEHRVTLPDGTVESIAPAPSFAEQIEQEPSASLSTIAGPTRRVPLGAIADARSGDKGNDANVGLWVSSEDAFAWLRSALTVARFRELVPEVGDRAVERYELPNLRALNFVLRGFLDGGAAAGLRLDRQAKALGEFVRSRALDVPTALLAPSAESGGDR